MIFEAFFGIVFRIDFKAHFLIKNRSKMNQKDVAAHPFFRPFSRLRFFMVLLVLLGSLLTALWHPLGSCWHPSGSYWDPFGPIQGQISVILHPRGFVLASFGRNSFFKAEICKKYSCIDPGIKFLANFRMQTIFPRPGGGTIAAGNRDSPPGRTRPSGACWASECFACFLPTCTLSSQ